MHKSDFTFHILDPKKRKKSQIKAALNPLSALHWLRVVGVRLSGYDQTDMRAQAALQSATKIPTSKFMRTVKLWLLARQYNYSRRRFQMALAEGQIPVAVCWNGLNGTRRVFMDGARDAGAQCLFFEHAPFPGRITVDTQGVNDANVLPRNIAPYLRWYEATPEAHDSWKNVSKAIQQRKGVTKFTSDADPDLPSLDQPFIFVPLQYQGDSQLRLFGGQCPDVQATIDVICRAAHALPEGWHIRFKEHPSSPASFRDALAAHKSLPIFIDNETDTFTQVRASQVVMTVNSSVGLEAMMFDKPVVVLGQAFWAIPGVAHLASDATTLIAVMAAPKALKIDPVSRVAFLAYLIWVYYPELVEASEGGYIMTATEQVKIRERLTTPMLSEHYLSMTDAGDGHSLEGDP